MNIGKSNNAARSSGIKIRWIGMNGLNAGQLSYETNVSEIFYAYYDRQYPEFDGAGHDGNPIVLLLFGAKKLPELARGMGRAVKEFSAARDEIEKGLSQSGPSGVAPSKLLDTESEQPSARQS
jgi:TatA/E family protein of Tat protein translocase